MHFGKSHLEDKREDLRSHYGKIEKTAGVTALRIAFCLLLVVLVCGAGLVIGAVRGVIDSAPDISEANIMPLGNASFIYDADGNQVQKLTGAQGNRVSISIEECLRHTYGIMIASYFSVKEGKKVMKKIVFATGNAGKMKEIREILADLPVEIYSMKEAGISVEIDENGKTFEENAKIKAQTVAGCTDGGTIVLADDSGLEVDALNGEPGVYSARYMGEDTSYRIKNQSLVDRLEGVPVEKRTARFVCVIAAAFPDGTVCTTKGTIEGKIGYEERGENGFGYDPIFYLPDMSRTTAELSPEEKNAVSHRGKALAAMKEQIASYLK